MRGLILVATATVFFVLLVGGVERPNLLTVPTPSEAPSPPERAGGEASTLNCGTDELWGKAPESIHNEQERLERQYRTYISGLGPNSRYRPRSEGIPAEVQNNNPQYRNPPPYTLPIVFHILHNNGTENISDARIQTSLDQLNASFANTGYYDQGTGVNTQIQFCLAQRTPDNLATNGITRTVTNLTDVDADTEDLALKDLARWNPREYVNVYVVREICGLGFGCGVAGYAYYPGAHGSGVDGIVVEARWLGDDEAGNAVLTHELGHYLGLAHTFNGGCTNDDCLTDGDRVCDTPPDNSTAAVPCSSSANTCTTDTDSGFATDQDDMHINYMDYGFFSCYSALTAGQRDRMHFFIEGIRRSLLDSYGCETPCPALVTAGFSGAPGGDVIVGNGINLINTSTGTTTYEWYVDGVLEATTVDFNFTFTTPGFYTVRLLALSGDPSLCSDEELSINVRVVCPYEADITASSLFPIEFTSTNFSTMDNAPFYEWTVDGVVVGNAASLDYSFPGSGIYELCLRKGNGGCEQETCQVIFVGNSFQPCEGQTFAQFIETGFDQVGGAFADAIVPDGGNLLLAGDLTNGIALARITALGQPVWSQWITPSNVPGFIGDLTHLLVDSEGNYLMAGYLETPNSSTLNACWLLKYDPINEAILYFNTFLEPTIIVDVFDDPATDTYRLTLNRLGFGQQHTAIQVVDRGSGGIVDLSLDVSQEHDLWNLEPQDAVWHSDQLFVVGKESLSSGTSGSTPFLQSFTAAANPVFANQQSLGINQVGEASAERLVVNDDGISVVGTLDGSSTTGLINLLTFSRFDLMGNLLWENHFEFFAGRVRPTALRAFNGGYLIALQLNDDASMPFSSSIGLVYLDVDGNLLWTRRIADPNVFFFHEDDQSLFTVTNSIFWTGVASVSDPGGPIGTGRRSFLFRLNEFGFFQDECLPIQEMEVAQLPAQQQRLSYSLNSMDPNSNWTSSPAIPLPITYLPTNTCGTPCFEICDNGIDDDFNGEIDCEDAALANTCCCLPAPVPPVLNDTTLCPGDTWTIVVPPYDGGIEWSTGSTSRQLIIDSAATYSLMVVDSCGRDSSVSFTVDYWPPSTPPDLGPDQVVCANGLTELDAGPGWSTYRWFDLSINQTATAWGAGNFWVEVTDSCGQVFGDTLTVTVLPATEIDLGPADSLINCSVDSLDFSVSGFAEYRWTPSGVVDCSTCPNVRVAVPPLGDSLTLFVLGFTEDGCAASDSIKIRTSAGLGLFETLAVCNGDSITYRDSVLTSPGQYLFPVDCSTPDTLLLEELPTPLPTMATLSLCAEDSVFLAGDWQFAPAMITDTLLGFNGCDSLHTFDLQLLLANPSTQEIQEVCPGDSAFIAGQWQSVAGDYPETFSGANGCDSVHVVQLQVLAAPTASQEFREICAGDSLLIGGEWQTEEGDYIDTLSATGGCDSLHTVTISWFPTLAYSSELAFRCNRYQVTILPSGGQAPYLIRWELEPGGPIFTNSTQILFPERPYPIEIEDANGCVLLDTLELPPILPVNFQVETFFPDCSAPGTAFLQINPLDSIRTLLINGQVIEPTDSIPLLGAGPFEIEIIDRLVCSNAFTFEPDVNNSDPLSIELVSQIIIQEGESVSLPASISGGQGPLIIDWLPTVDLSCIDCLQPNASPPTTTEYTLRVTDSLGCTATATVRVIVELGELVYVPNAFSPNDDGVNDFFFPGLGPAVVQIKRFEIYDRWGGRLFSTADLPASAPPSTGWDGRSNGQAASLGVYIYLLEVELADGRQIPLAGEVMLIR
ncbi:MAG: M43 family zinc metalloprotease [Bacteroidota bacterium]